MLLDNTVIIFSEDPISQQEGEEAWRQNLFSVRKKVEDTVMNISCEISEHFVTIFILKLTLTQRTVKMFLFFFQFQHLLLFQSQTILE